MNIKTEDFPKYDFSLLVKQLHSWGLGLIYIELINRNKFSKILKTWIPRAR